MSRSDILLATRNPGKIRELRPLLEGAGFTVVDLESFGLEPDAAEEELERHGTFDENALAKGRYFYEASGGVAAIADDSGLEVLALGGAPGVRSRRWSGGGGLAGLAQDEANNARLVAELTPLSDRRARYVCAAAFVGPDSELVRRGETAGKIVLTPRGLGGFGYDPHFECADLGGRTFGECDVAEKALVSHRGRAVRALIAALGSGS